MTVRIWKGVGAALAITLAAGAAQAGVGTPPVAAAQSTAGVSSKAIEKRYCIRDTRTGSRLAKTMCHTRDEWLARGVDPLDPQK